MDGPFRGLKGENWLMKGILMPQNSNFATSYGNNAIAYWHAPISHDKLIKLDDKIIDFFENYAGGQIDENSSFNLNDRNEIFNSKMLQSFSLNQGIELSRWLKWKSNSSEGDAISYDGSLTRQKLTDFLLSQNTLEALKYALVISPMNKEVMRELGKNYYKLSSEKKFDKKTRDFYRIRGEWYSSKAAETNNN